MASPKKKNSITVFAPASVGNLACGFDSMGLAITNPGDIITLEKNSERRLIIREITGDNGKLSYDIKKNTASVAIHSFLEEHKIKQGFNIYLQKNMAMGSGLGSSAASAVAGVYAAAMLIDNRLSKPELIRHAMEGERIACGSAHADNVAPSMLGGITLVRSNNPLDIVSLPVPSQLYIAVVHPHIEVLTKDARAVLKKEIPLPVAVQQWSNTAAFVSALHTNDYNLIGRSVIDLVAEPYRAALIPVFHKVKKAALQNGALACSISGSGPSLFTLCRGLKNCREAGKAMREVFLKAKVMNDVYISKVNTEGARVIS
jgi:homoserine kinase